MTPLMLLLIQLVLAASTAAAPHAHISESPTPTPSSTSHQSGGEEYVVLFRSSNPPLVAEVLSRIELSPDHPDVRQLYNNSAFRGFVASMKTHCIDALNAMDDVVEIEKNAVVTTQDYARQNAPWGLQRISSANSVRGDPQAVDFVYTYSDSKLGQGVDIYTIDTGINTDHVSFQKRARMGYSLDGADFSDHDGHGTHVSGTAAATTFGVASGANLIGIKVLGAEGKGKVSDTIAGMDWVIQQHDINRDRPAFVGSIMSMSFAVDGLSRGMQDAIDRAILQGIHVSVAAGNAAQDACGSSPSASGGVRGPAVTVGSIGNDDRISSFSNTGDCVDLYAPGEDIMSTWHTGENIVQILSGTSMAAPHVTGLMAYLIAEHPEFATNPPLLKAYLKQTAVQKNGILIANNGVKFTSTKRRI